MGFCRDTALWIAGLCALAGLVPVTGPGRTQAADLAHLSCTVKGAAFFRPATTVDAICARFRATLVEATGQNPGTGDVGESAKSGALDIVISVSKRGILTATIIDKRHGKNKTYPPVSVAVSDRAPSLSSVTLLARGVAAELADAS